MSKPRILRPPVTNWLVTHSSNIIRQGAWFSFDNSHSQGQSHWSPGTERFSPRIFFLEKTQPGNRSHVNGFQGLTNGRLNLLIFWFSTPWNLWINNSKPSMSQQVAGRVVELHNQLLSLFLACFWRHFQRIRHQSSGWKVSASSCLRTECEIQLYNHIVCVCVCVPKVSRGVCLFEC